MIAAPAIRSGIVTECTGVTPPNELLLPPQNALAARRGDAVEGRSLCVFGVSNDDVDATFRDAGAGAEMDSGLGGGRTGEPARPAGARRAFLSALISCCRTAFSDFVEPSSARIASMSRSRSATSPSSVLIYSVRRHKSLSYQIREERVKRMLTLATVAEVTSANLVAQLAFFFAGHFLVLLVSGAPVVQGVVERVGLYDGADMDLFLDTTRVDDRLAIPDFVGGFSRGRSYRALVVLIVLLFRAMLVLRRLIVTEITCSLGSCRCRHELRVDGKRWRETTRCTGGPRIGAIMR